MNYLKLAVKITCIIKCSLSSFYSKTECYGVVVVMHVSYMGGHIFESEATGHLERNFV